MKEIRIHGRGGQGVVTSAEIIAIAAFHSGSFAQAFPYFGVERTGAPIEAYARIDNKPIRLREHVYSPEILVITDAGLTDDQTTASGCSENTIAIINTNLSSNKFVIKNIKPEKIYTIDATGISLKILGKNMPNTVLLGALAKISGLITWPGLEQAIKEKFKNKDKEIIKKNIAVAKIAYHQNYEN